MMEQAEKSVEGVGSSNADFINNSALQIRLETNHLLEQIEFFLRGLEPNTYWNKETQSWQIKLKEMGSPKCNSIGIQALLNKCRSLINPQVVQGNFDKDFYLILIRDIRIEIAHLLFTNYYYWEMQNKVDIKEITDTIMNIVESFLSRPINNKERESYAQTIRTNETNTFAGKGGGLNFFGGKE